MCKANDANSAGLFAGIGTVDWMAKQEHGIRWIESPPLAGRPSYPAFLDLVETVRNVLPQPWPLLEVAIRALAPEWADLENSGLQPEVVHEPRIIELAATDEAPIVQRFIACGMAQVLARLPEGYGISIRSSELWDPSSLEFLERLILEPTRSVPICLETTSNPSCSPNIASLTAGATYIPGPRRRARPLPPEAARVLCLCPHGLPLAVLETLGVKSLDETSCFEWPGGGKAVALPPGPASRIRRAMDRRERISLHSAIFDAHPVKGWNYIRRAGHAIGSREAGRLLLQHTGSLAAFAQVGYDFLYDHLVALAAVCPPTSFVAAHVGAARIAPRLWGRNGRHRAISHYRRALKFTGLETASALAIMHELANVYATTRTPEALKKARACYEALFERLELLTDPYERRSFEIRLHNGLALVDYHEGHDTEALDHEREALSLISLLPEKADGSWAAPLVRTNTAKLLIKRFGDADGAAALLCSLLESPEIRVRKTTHQNLGRTCFDKMDYQGVVEHLAPWVENVEGRDLSETEELYDRIIFVLSLIALKEVPRARRQLPRMHYLARVNAGDSAKAMINKISLVLTDFDSEMTKAWPAIRAG